MQYRRFLSLLLAALLLCSLAPETGRADPTVYFISVNDQLLPDLNDSTMPFWSGGRLYVPYTAVSGTDLGVFYALSRDKQTAVVYRQGSALTFDLSSGSVADQDGKQYGSPAIVRGDVVFLPVDLLTQFFALDYSYTRVAYGYLVRLKSDAVVLPDAKFIEAASSAMEQRYTEYLKTYNDGGSTPEVPNINTDDSLDRAYLIVRVTDAQASAALLDALADVSGRATFLFSEKQLPESGDLLRRLLISGSAAALDIDASGGASRTLGAIERGNRALWAACNAKTRLVYLSGASEATVRAVQEAGYCPITLDLDYSGELPSSSRAASRILSLARRGGCAVCLGADSAAQDIWNTLLARLRASSCPISQLNELSAQREA